MFQMSGAPAQNVVPSAQGEPSPVGVAPPQGVPAPLPFRCSGSTCRSPFRDHGQGLKGQI